MPEISDETKVTVPLRNLIGLGASLVVATAAYVTLNSRITTLEHGQSIQDMTIKKTQHLYVSGLWDSEVHYLMTSSRTLRLWLWKNSQKKSGNSGQR